MSVLSRSQAEYTPEEFADFVERVSNEATATGDAALREVVFMFGHILIAFHERLWDLEHSNPSETGGRE